MSSGSSPITSPPLLQKHVKSKGPSLHPVSGASQVLFPFPTPARICTQSAVVGRYPTSGTGLPRCIRYFPDMPSSLPRWTTSSASIGFFLVCFGLPRILGGSASTTLLSRPACSRFTHITACRFAANLKVLLLSPELRAEGLPLHLSG